MMMMFLVSLFLRFSKFSFNIFPRDMADLAQYADLFLTNNITGRRLLRITEKDLKQMGIASVGHIMDFQVSIFTGENVAIQC